MKVMMNGLLCASIAIASVAPCLALPNPKPMEIREANAIGTVESMEPVEINGITGHRSEIVQNGDIIRAAGKATARIIVAAGGQITLRNGGAVRIGMNEFTRTLSALVLKGEAYTELDSNYTGLFEVGNARFITSRGARVRIANRDGKPDFEAVSGYAMNVGEWKLRIGGESGDSEKTRKKYRIQPIDDQGGDVPHRGKRELKFKVTDEKDQPVESVPVTFMIVREGSLVSAGSFGGQPILKGLTDADGIATALFSGSGGGQVTVTAVEEVTDGSCQRTVNVAKPGGFWSPQTAIPVLAIAGAAAGAGIYKATNRRAIVVTPPIDIKPGSTGILP